MKRTALLLCMVGLLMPACHHTTHGPYRNYKVTNDEAVPACQFGGAPYRQRR